MIEIKNLTKRFQDFTALENVTCTIGSGCIYGMVGSNGAGKSSPVCISRTAVKSASTANRSGIILL